MSWPLSHEYNEAVQTPKLAFNDPDLKAGEAVVGAQGLPLPRSGNFADVYQIRGADGKDWAVKCFTRPVVGLADRYARVSEALERLKLPFVVGFNFLAEGVRVGGVWRPAVKMEWVEGLMLNQVVRENAGRPAVLAALGQMWVRLAKRLREAKVAHADLQHGNVLLVPGGRPGAYGLKLIDYDGMYVPALANQPSGEVGHPAYQHPARAATRAYSPDLDRFPHLVVLTALKGLEVTGAGLWDRYDTGDNLLFTEEDFRNPSASKLMRELWQTGHPALQSLVGRLAVACGKPIPQTPWADEVAPEGEVKPLDDDARRAAAAALGVAVPVVTALPPEPDHAAAPAVVLPLPDQPGEGIDVALVDASTRGRKYEPKRPAYRPPAEGGKGGGRVALIAGGVLLLAGCVAVAVMLAGNKDRPDDTVQTPVDPEKKGSDPEPKEDDKRPPGGKPKDPEKKEPEKKDPEQKQSEKNPLRGVPFELKPVGKLRGVERWSVPLGTDPPAVRVVPGTDSRLLAVTGLSFGSFCLDAATGAKLPGSENKILPPIRGAVALDGGRFLAPPTRPGAPIPVWNPRAGKWEEPLKPVEGVGASGGQTFASRDARYLAFGSFAPMDAPAPFKLKNVETGAVILDENLVRGRAFFTADSSRVLVEDQTGKCRWYAHTPSAFPDGSRNQRQGPGGSGVVVMSPGGELVFVQARLADGAGFFHLLDARDGRVLRSFNGPYSSQSGNPLSDDGRLAVFLMRGPNSTSAVEVVETATGNTVARLIAPAGKQYNSADLLPDGSAVVAVLGDPPAPQKTEQPQSAVRYDLVPNGSAPPPVTPAVDVGKPAEWAVVADTGRETAVLHVNPAANLVLVGNPVAGRAVFEYATGKSRDVTSYFRELGEFGVADVFALDRGRVATVTQHADEIQVWDAAEGKLLETIPVPDLPPGAGRAKRLRAALSPDGRYLAVGRCGEPSADNPEVPFRVFEVATNRQVLATTWKGGSVHFTADSKRVLVAEWSGRVRWFDTGSGSAAGGWDFGPAQAGRFHHVYGVSPDGSAVAYRGPAGSKSGESGPAVVNAKGEVVRRLTRHHPASDVCLSADGRRAALLLEVAATACTFDVIDVATGKSLREVPVATGRPLPSFALSPDGGSLVVHDTGTNQLHRFVVPAPKSP